MSIIKLQHVRLSFPSLFTTALYNGKDTGKFKAAFILDKKKHRASIKEIEDNMKKLAEDKLRGKLPPPTYLCLKDGDKTERPEYQGCMIVKTATKKRPLVLDKNKHPLTEQDGIIYSGCYVNVLLSLWAQDNQHDKRVNAQLEGVQFNEDGEPFGPAGVDINEFDAFGSGDDTDDDLPF